MNDENLENQFLAASKNEINKKEFLRHLMDTYGSYVIRLAYSYTKDSNSAEDISQDVFVKAYKSFDQFRGESSLKTWITRITINTSKDYLKSSWHNKVCFFQNKYFNLLNAKEKKTEIQFIDKEENDRLIKGILLLPLKYREVILLYYYQDISTKELSFLLNVPIATIRTRLSRGRKLLKDYWEVEEE
jgi:RNA polymerase sigma-70 factor, ECF subfamily